jgi:hypothetical protein
MGVRAARRATVPFPLVNEDSVMPNSYETTAMASPETARLMDRIKELLDSGRPQEAFMLLSRDSSEWARNARAVCYLRLGDAQAAVDALRGLVVTGHLNLRREAPLVFKTNFATALFLSGNISGGESVLSDLRDETDDGVQKLRAAVAMWKSSMTFWEKLRWWLGGEPARPLTLDYPPGNP